MKRKVIFIGAMMAISVVALAVANGPPKVLTAPKPTVGISLPALVAPADLSNLSPVTNVDEGALHSPNTYCAKGPPKIPGVTCWSNGQVWVEQGLQCHADPKARVAMAC